MRLSGVLTPTAELFCIEAKTTLLQVGSVKIKESSLKTE